MPTEDPFDLASVDEAIARNELEIRAEAMGVNLSPDCPTGMGHEFINSVERWENAEWTTNFDMMERAGISLPPPETLDDATINAKLAEIFDALARMNTFVTNTNHLSDRALYERLFHDILREETKDLGDVPGYVCHIDILGSGSDEDLQLSLRYYADDEERASWLREWPDLHMPPREKPPYDRDRHLPQAPQPPRFELNGGDDDGFTTPEDDGEADRPMADDDIRF